MKSLIGIGTALLLDAALLVVALLSLKGAPLALAVIIVLGLAAKSYVHHLRSRLE